MITTVNFRHPKIFFSYDFLDIQDHPIIGIPYGIGITESFREFGRYVKIPVSTCRVWVSKRP